MTASPLPVPVHAVGDDLPRVRLRPRPLVSLRALGGLLALFVAVLLLTVDIVPLVALTAAVAVAAPILITLIRNTEWM